VQCIATFVLLCALIDACTRGLQVAALPYMQTNVATLRNKANRTLGFLEPWQIAVCAASATFAVLWIYDLLFKREESMCYV